MERSLFSEADSDPTNQEIPRLLSNPKVHYRVHNSPELDTILSHMNLVHTFRHYICTIHSNIIFPSMPRSSEWHLPLRFRDRNLVSLIRPVRASVPRMSLARHFV